MKNYNQADQVLHFLSQVIAKTNRHYVPAKADDSHSNLYFDVLGNRIVGRWIETLAGKMILTLNLSTLAFEWYDDKQNLVQSVKSTGIKLEHVESEITEQLTNFGLDPGGFREGLHYTIPDYPVSNMEVLPLGDAQISAWKHFRKLANQACSLLLGYLQIEGEIRIWPNHFDTGIYVSRNGMGLGFGLATQDEMFAKPYFYMTGYSEKGTLQFDKLPNLGVGTWETGEKWQGAVLLLPVLKRLSDEQQESAIKNYIMKAADWYMS